MTELRLLLPPVLECVVPGALGLALYFCTGDFVRLHLAEPIHLRRSRLLSARRPFGSEHRSNESSESTLRGLARYAELQHAPIKHRSGLSGDWPTMHLLIGLGLTVA